MAVIPITQPRPTLDVPTTPAPQYSDASAQVLQGFGAAISDLAAMAAALPALDLEANFQRFKFEETQNWNKETFSLNPAESYGFADRYDTGYDDRAGKWETENLARMTPGERARYQARLVGLKSDLYGRSLTLEREQQLSYINNKVLETLNTTILPRVRDVALLPDDANKVTALAVIEADAIALIDAAPISETAKEALKDDTRKSIHAGFAQSLPPLEKQRLGGAVGSDFVTRIMQIEGTGKNPLSSAEGPGGFIDSTWIDLIKRYRPELAEGKTDAEILALRTDEHFPLLGEAMVRAYAAENTAYLQANGLSATAGNLYLAHFLGPEGAVAMLNANPAEAAASVSVDPDAPKKNPDVFYYKDHNGVSDPSRPRSVADIVSWASALMGGTYATDWSRYLDALSYADKMAFAADGSQALIRQQTARQAEMQAAYDIQLNDTLNAVADGIYGLSDLSADYDNGEGWLTNYADRKRVYDAIQARDKEALNLAAATALYNSDQAIIPQLDAHKKAMNLLWDKGLGGSDDLFESDGGTMDRAVNFVRRTGMVPESLVARLQNGIFLDDPALRDRALGMLDRLAKENPTAVNRDFEPDDLRRLSLANALNGVVPDEVRNKELAVSDPETAKRHQELADKGREIAQRRPLVWPGGMPTGDPSVQLEARRDYETNFAIAYSYVKNEAAADKLAKQWMAQEKWGMTDVGSGPPEFMAYPPQRFYGDSSALDDQLAVTMEAYNPRATEYGVEAADDAAKQIADKKLPGYKVWYKDEVGGFHYVTDADTPLIPKVLYFTPSATPGSDPESLTGAPGVVSPPSVVTAPPLDPNEYLRLFDLSTTEPQRALEEVRKAYAEQRVPISVYNAIYTHAKNVIAGAELPAYFKSMDSFVSGALRPRGDATSRELADYMDAQFVWDDWVQKHQDATREEAQAFGESLVSNSRRYVAGYKRQTLPIPRFAGVPNRWLINEEVVKRAQEQTVKALTDGTISEATARDQARLLKQWLDAIGLTPGMQMPP